MSTITMKNYSKDAKYFEKSFLLTSSKVKMAMLVNNSILRNETNKSNKNKHRVYQENKLVKETENALTISTGSDSLHNVLCRI